MLAALGELVSHESPSRDRDRLNSLAERIADRFRDVTDEARLIEGELGRHLILTVRAAEGHEREPGGLVVGHFDTVWPVGTIDRWPFRVEGGRASGPGAYDMKASLVMVEFALRVIRGRGLRPPRPVTILFTADEEIGSPTSRGLIEEQARGAAYALVVEPPLANGGLKTARKGVGRFHLEVTGKAAHSGVEPEKGVSAVVELAHQILAVQALANPEAGTTLNVGVVRGGTTPNVVPAAATAEIDARATSLAEARRVEAAMAALAPVLPGASLRVSGGFNRPPMERSPAIVDLFQKARAIGKSVGLDLTEGSTGGGSDGNFTAALGVPTLDGLGAPGGGAHADEEHVAVADLPTRTALLAALLMGL